MYFGPNSDDDVTEYVANGNNLNEVFKHWSTVFDSEGWLAFSNAVGASCMDVVQSET